MSKKKKKKKENMQHMTSGTHTINRSHQPCVDVHKANPNPNLELDGMTKNVYHGIFLNYTGFTVYDGIYFFHA